jgi:hypothetical protein
VRIFIERHERTIDLSAKDPYNAPGIFLSGDTNRAATPFTPEVERESWFSDVR